MEEEQQIIENSKTQECEMTIENKTIFQKEYIRTMVWAGHAADEKYKRFKLIYNMFGLLAGMMCVRCAVFDITGQQTGGRSFIYIYGAVAAVCLYIGMYGMDNQQFKKSRDKYKDIVGTAFIYRMNQERIEIAIGEKDVISFGWNDIEQIRQDMNCFYIYMKEQELCFVMDKRGFITGDVAAMQRLLRENTATQ